MLVCACISEHEIRSFICEKILLGLIFTITFIIRHKKAFLKTSKPMKDTCTYHYELARNVYGDFSNFLFKKRLIKSKTTRIINEMIDVIIAGTATLQ